VPRDLVLAHKWLNLSASHSAGETREYRSWIRDKIASKMTFQEVTLARDLALAWRPRRER
jgi:hypothetical protein